MKKEFSDLKQSGSVVILFLCSTPKKCEGFKVNGKKSDEREKKIKSAKDVRVKANATNVHLNRFVTEKVYTRNKQGSYRKLNSFVAQR